MEIMFWAKKVTTEVVYKVWAAEWQGTPWADAMEPFDDQRITVTSIGPNNVGVEIHSTKTGEPLAVIPGDALVDAPQWLQDLVKHTVELV